jgi:hypothetical protein
MESSNNTTSYEPLPLGWTQVRRRRTTTTTTNTTNSNTTTKRKFDDATNDDNNCIVGNDDDDVENDNNIDAYGNCRCAIHQQQYIMNHDEPDTTIVGRAIFCLHDTDPQWFLGYFVFTPPPPTSSYETDPIGTAVQSDTERDRQPIVPTGTVKISNNTVESTDDIIRRNATDNLPYWGLLCQQEAIDECLQCQDGGYRQLTITITPFHPKKKETTSVVTANCPYNDQLNYKRKIQNVIWTGGDMIQLFYQSKSSSRMNNDDTDDKKEIIQQMIVETDQLLTGTKAIPYIKKYFSSLLRNIQAHACSIQDDDDHPNANKIRTSEESVQATTTEEEEGAKILELIPNAVIVLGTVSLQFTISKVTNQPKRQLINKSIIQSRSRNSTKGTNSDDKVDENNITRTMMIPNKSKRISDTTFDPLFDDDDL